ncbi:sensor histidine kinase [Amnibacterium setariae]|uniref:histidine kinase n=1 Tax=Amnibacterium setariae TaxID=2306585 RepID=A0A3A1U3I8_9MICO|nr:histidine kinase [Amnibacterium setariae]RIX27574.1 two-component sensor histidine kinase [Amnibacterium setariae]
MRAVQDEGTPAPGHPAALLLRHLAARRSPSGLALDLALAGLLLAVGLLAARWPVRVDPVEVLLAGAASLAVRRVLPSAALALGWLTVLWQVTSHAPPSLVQVASAAVVYSAAAWGGRAELVVAAVSASLGGLAGGLYLVQTRFASITLRYGEPAVGARDDTALLVIVVPAAILTACWTAGFAVRTIRARLAETAQRALAEGRAAEAQEQAGVEQARTAMARDVHDVVGHSLAVIIAQADSVRFLDDADRVRDVVGTIAATARSSLLEVRDVLERTEPVPSRDGADLDALVAQVRSAGVEVQERTEGEPGALDADPGLAARRVLQEMLANALRHGRPGGVVEVQRLWRDADLVLEVGNAVGPGGTGGSGAGLPGMRDRVEAVGGSLGTDRIGERFVARVRIPRTAAP